MSSSSWSHEVESSVPAARLFRAAVLDWHNLGPKLVPDIIASGSPVSGDGGVGSVRQLNFTSAMPFSYVKEQLDFLDLERLECKQSLIEGGALGKRLEAASSHFKFDQLSNGGCSVKMVTTYKAFPGAEVTEAIKKAKKGVTGMIRATEAYLLANPTAYA